MGYLEKIKRFTREQLLDHVEAVWRGEETITDLEREQLKEEILYRKSTALGDYVQFYAVLLSLVEITRRAQANADPDKKLTAAQLAGAALVMYLYRDLPRPEPPQEYDLMWVTRGDDKVCPICAPLNGMILGQDIGMLITTHPGCRCYTVDVPKVRRAMDKIGLKEAGAVRALSEGQKRILEVLAAPFGSPRRKDKLGQFFSARTNFMIGLGEKRPLLYFHGFSPRGRRMKNPPTIGTAITSRQDEDGLWMRAELVPPGTNELADRTWKAALEGKARASTGSVNYLEDHDEHTGEVYVWPIAELSVFDSGDERIPVSDDAVVLPLRALFTKCDIPYNFEAGEDKKEGDDQPTIRTKEINMNEVQKAVQEALAAEREKERLEQEAREAMRAEIIKELKAEPNYRSTFNINTIDDSKAKKNADDEEEFAFYRALLGDARKVAEGGMPHGLPRNFDRRTLEETEAAELGSLVPDQVVNKIHSLLQEYSVVDYLASIGKMTIHKADRLTITAPQVTTAMSALDDIAEEGAYTANEPVIEAKQATMQKVGNYVKVTEEALDDQTAFQSWFPSECARAVALSKNADLYALTNAIAGTDVGTRSTMTDAEVVGLYYGLPQQYRRKGVFIMNDDTLSYIRQMLVATPRAYGEFGFQPYSMGEQGEFFLNKPVIANENWHSIVAADAADKVVDFVNMDEAIYWAERKKLSIFVDPYTSRLTAGVINFLPMARYGGVVKNTDAMSGIDGKDA